MGFDCDATASFALTPQVIWWSLDCPTAGAFRSAMNCTGGIREYGWRISIEGTLCLWFSFCTILFTQARHLCFDAHFPFYMLCSLVQSDFHGVPPNKVDTTNIFNTSVFDWTFSLPLVILDATPLYDHDVNVDFPSFRPLLNIDLLLCRCNCVEVHVTTKDIVWHRYFDAQARCVEAVGVAVDSVLVEPNNAVLPFVTQWANKITSGPMWKVRRASHSSVNCRRCSSRNIVCFFLREIWMVSNTRLNSSDPLGLAS